MATKKNTNMVESNNSKSVEEVAHDLKEAVKQAEPINQRIKSDKEFLYEDSRKALGDPSRKTEFNGQTRSIIPGVQVGYSILNKCSFDVPKEKDAVLDLVMGCFQTNLWKAITFDPKKVVNPTAKELKLLAKIGWKVVQQIIWRTTFNSTQSAS